MGGKMAIDFIKEEDRFLSRIMEFTLMPEAWQNFRSKENDFPCSWKMIKLDELNKNNPELTTESGIYTLLVQPAIASHPACSYLMYVGQTHNLQQRFLNYLRREKRIRKRPKVLRLLNIYFEQIWFCFTKISANQLDDYEKALMNAYIPPINDKNQLPAEIRSIIGAFR